MTHTTVPLPHDDGELRKRIIITRHELRTTRIREYSKARNGRSPANRTTATAFVGSASFGLIKSNHSERDIASRRFGALLALAQYSGLGEGTARGRGAMRVKVDG